MTGIWSIPASWKDPRNVWAPEIEDGEETQSLFTFTPASATRAYARACDFTFWTAQKATFRKEGIDATAATQAKREEDEFTFVDTTKSLRVSAQRKPAVMMRRPIRPSATATAPDYVNRTQQTAQSRNRGFPARGFKKDKMAAAYQPRNQASNMLRWNNPRNRAVMVEYAVETPTDLPQVADLSLQSLGLRQLDPKNIRITDFAWKGKTKYWNKELERVNARAPKVVSPTWSTQLTHVQPATREDSVLTSILTEREDVNVIISDQILCTLLTACLSRYGWQIICYKIEGKLIFGKPSNSTLDLLTVNETAAEMPVTENRGRESGLESAKTHLDVLALATAEQPVAEDRGAHDGFEVPVPDNKLYRYRLVELPPGRLLPNVAESHVRKKQIVMAVRTEIDALMKEGDNEEYVKVHTLTEGLARPGSQPWVTALEKSKGSWLMNELKNNTCKFGKWAFGAMLAGAGQMKIAFVTKKNQNQMLLGVQNSRVVDLVTQMSLKVPNAWGCLREILDIILSDSNEDGQYIINRENLTLQVKIHYNPSFEEDSDRNSNEDQDDEE